jgi:dienelactone hydrolase
VLLVALLLGTTAPAGAQHQRLDLWVPGPRPLDCTVYIPAGPGPFPLVVLGHGSVPGPLHRRRTPYPRPGAWFAERGFFVVVPMRGGYPRTFGPWSDEYRFDTGVDFQRSGLSGAADLRAALQFFGARPDVDRRRVLLVGHSGGGFASLALSSVPPAGLLGVINFAGGRAARDTAHRDQQIDALAAYGRTSRVPTLWIYAENDTFFPPPFARRLHGAFIAAGGRAELLLVEPFEQEGHGLIQRPRRWAALVMPFLRRLGLLR